MPIWRLCGGTSVTCSPSMAISPLSGRRNPATRLSSVVLPQPDGPSSVISSPRRTCSEASCSAVTAPKRLVTPSSRTASDVSRSARMLNVQHLSETEEGGGESQQGRGHDDVHDRNRRHRGVGVFAHVVVHGDRQGLGALGGDEQR